MKNTYEIGDRVVTFPKDLASGRGTIVEIGLKGEMVRVAEEYSTVNGKKLTEKNWFFVYEVTPVVRDDDSVTF